MLELGFLCCTNSLTKLNNIALLWNVMFQADLILKTTLFTLDCCSLVGSYWNEITATVNETNR